MNEAKEVELPGRPSVIARLDFRDALKGEQPTVVIYAIRQGRVDAQFTVEEATLVLAAWREMLAQHQKRVSPPLDQDTNTGHGELYI